MKKNIVSIICFSIFTMVFFTACKKEQNGTVPIVVFDFENIKDDSLFINLTADQDFAILPVSYSVKTSAPIRSLFYLRRNISKPVPEAVGKTEYSVSITDTLTPGVYGLRTEVKDENGMSQSANLTIVVKGVEPVPIFDPANYPAEFLTSNMEIVTIDNVEYMRFIFAGWGSQIKIPDFVIDTVSKTSYRYKVKYAMGAQSLGKGLVEAKTYVNINFGDVNNRVPASWDPNEMIPSEIESDFSQGYLNHSFREITGSLIDDKVRTISFLKVFSMETVTWDATVGDTIWISKIVPFRPE